MREKGAAQVPEGKSVKSVQPPPIFAKPDPPKSTVSRVSGPPGEEAHNSGDRNEEELFSYDPELADLITQFQAKKREEENKDREFRAAKATSRRQSMAPRPSDAGLGEDQLWLPTARLVMNCWFF